MSEQRIKLEALAMNWFSRVNAELEMRGAPSLGSLSEHTTFFEQTDEGSYLAVNIMNFAVVGFGADHGEAAVDVTLSVNETPGYISTHKVAVLTNVLSFVRLKGCKRLTIGVPFTIVDGEMSWQIEPTR